MSDPILGDVFKRFILPAGKQAALDQIAGTLVARGGDVAAKDNVVKALRRLLVDGKFNLSDGPIAPAEMGSFLGQAQKALKLALIASGQPQIAALGELTAGAIKFINNSFDRCGGNDVGNPPPGPPVAVTSGKPTIVFFLEEDANGLPMLPAIAGCRLARTQLMLA
jgi:hypothetical protein